MPNPTNQNPETLEAAREMLLQNSETIRGLQQQVETLTAERTERDTTIETLRTLNQQLFLRASQGVTAPESEPEETKPQSLEDFAKTTLKGVFI